MSKGTERERQARECYEAAGYDPQPARGNRYRESDWWNLFDFGAVRSGELVLAQVKANRVRGISQWFEDAQPFTAISGVRVHYLVCHDREGWRLAEADADATRRYQWVVDEREKDCTMGDRVTAYLKDQTA